ncbi:MAG: hypothetical protein EXS16_01360 [Gemmataceae bacterium]|nr:hypothetical protein [Gemmataceae bacterium]
MWILDFCFAVDVVLLLIIFSNMWADEKFHEKFPPISDAEFVAMCKPGVNPEIALKVRRIVADSLGLSYKQVYPSASFADLGVD